jgi:uncharacterized protein YbjT (DUF2867 family)
VSDVGKAAAADILTVTSKHNGKTYKVVAPAFSLKNAAAAAFSKTLGKEVTVTTVPHEAAKEGLMGMGFPEWQTDGILSCSSILTRLAQLQTRLRRLVILS